MKHFTHLNGKNKSAVKSAKDVSFEDLPQTLYKDGIAIDRDQLPGKLAEYFDSKILQLSNMLPKSEDVYNGTKKLHPENKMFVQITVYHALNSALLKSKRTLDNI